AMEPHYIMRKTEAGVYIKISDCGPDDWCMSQGEDDKEDGCAIWIRYADAVKQCEKATVVLLENDRLVRDLEDAIVKAGALSWNGYNKRKSMKRVADSGDMYRMYMEYSDGAKVNVYGYNCCPKGFKDLLRDVREIFNNIPCS
ncbi:MAG: hypothetical protein IJB96_01590, partial [Lachnospira sp.]|nr:hypothetical protein [Lachnospira sp.]